MGAAARGTLSRSAASESRLGWSAWNIPSPGWSPTTRAAIEASPSSRGSSGGRDATWIDFSSTRLPYLGSATGSPPAPEADPGATPADGFAEQPQR